MPADRAIFTTRTWLCTECSNNRKVLGWDYDPAPECCGPMDLVSPSGQAPFVIGDEIDRWVPHGPCWPDGSPRHYTSRAELKREEIRTGWCKVGDTPRPDIRERMFGSPTPDR